MLAVYTTRIEADRRRGAGPARQRQPGRERRPSRASDRHYRRLARSASRSPPTSSPSSAAASARSPRHFTTASGPRGRARHLCRARQGGSRRLRARRAQALDALGRGGLRPRIRSRRLQHRRRVRLQHGRDGEQGPQHLQRQIRPGRPRDRDRRRLRQYRGDHRARIFPQLDRQPHHLPRLVPALPEGRPDGLPRPGILVRRALAPGAAHRRGRRPCGRGSSPRMRAPSPIRCARRNIARSTTSTPRPSTRRAPRSSACSRRSSATRTSGAAWTSTSSAATARPRRSRISWPAFAEATRPRPRPFRALVRAGRHAARHGEGPLRCRRRRPTASTSRRDAADAGPAEKEPMVIPVALGLVVARRDAARRCGPATGVDRADGVFVLDETADSDHLHRRVEPAGPVAAARLLGAGEAVARSRRTTNCSRCFGTTAIRSTAGRRRRPLPCASCRRTSTGKAKSRTGRRRRFAAALRRLHGRDADRRSGLRRARRDAAERSRHRAGDRAGRRSRCDPPARPSCAAGSAVALHRRSLRELLRSPAASGRLQPRRGKRRPARPAQRRARPHRRGRPGAARRSPSAQFDCRDNMTDRLAALERSDHHPRRSARSGARRLRRALSRRAARARQMVHPAGRHPRGRRRSTACKALMEHPAFSHRQSRTGCARSIGSFAMLNQTQFNRADGAGYAFLADIVLAARRHQSAARGATSDVRSDLAHAGTGPPRTGRAELSQSRRAKAGPFRGCGDIAETLAWTRTSEIIPTVWTSYSCNRRHTLRVVGKI